MNATSLDTFRKRIRTFISDDTIVFLDLLFGLRGWGLILYGVLPANLALLGVLEVKLTSLDKLTRFLMPIVFLPLLTTFLLIKQRHKEWYLTTKLLKTRSFIVTVIIFLLASLITGISGIIQGKYDVSWNYFGTREHLTTIAESFVIAVGSLVLTSTLFLTILTKESNFPGLPSVDFVKLLSTIRTDLKRLQQSQVWSGFSGLDRDTATCAQRVEENLTALLSYSNLELVNLSLQPVRAGIESFVRGIERIRDASNDASKTIAWNQYFTDAMEKPTKGKTKPVLPAIQKDASNIRILKQLPLG
jgi:hypothetical protein